MAMNLVKLPTGKPNLQLRVSKGHYATSHSHINYYIDVTLTKFRLSEARAAAAELIRAYKSTTIVDTILCLDGTEVIGACMASELTKSGFANMNAHQTIYVVTPEHTTGSQLLFRENTAPTGYTVQGAIEAIRYYGGEAVGIAAIFASVDECAGYPVASIFDTHDLPDYETHDSHSCPWCKQGKKIDALVNSFGYSSL